MNDLTTYQPRPSRAHARRRPRLDPSAMLIGLAVGLVLAIGVTVTVLHSRTSRTVQGDTVTVHTVTTSTTVGTTSTTGAPVLTDPVTTVIAGVPVTVWTGTAASPNGVQAPQVGTYQWTSPGGPGQDRAGTREFTGYAP